ncbi:chalcone isomerase family protein [Hydrogenophaga sp.]|uniref:chalcone isomerase family protein n=1 Tax=Hydrogenophaga sp. TaxID=1904254 RepID=UPI003F728FE3
MRASTVAALALLAGALALTAGISQAMPAEATTSAALKDQPRLGTARLRVWGFEVYDASLYAAPGFDAQRFAEQRFGLELNYLRSFKGPDIAERSLDEMRRVGTIDAAQAEGWLRAMSALFPDVQRGDRITGVHVPGAGARFYLNGQWLGEVADESFSRLFFGIWLSPRTSQPAMRRALIDPSGAGTRPSS